MSKESFEKRREEDFVVVRRLPSLYYNNDFHQYDPDSDSFTRLSTTGKHFSPRSDFGVATLGNRVYVHGGHCNGRLKDFLMLDMSDMNQLQWTEFKDSGFPTGISSHSLSPISSTQLLLVGGRLKDGISDQVKIFDVETSEWKSGGRIEGGRCNHGTAFALRDGNCGMVICLGGYIDASQRTHPNHMTIFEIAE